MSNNLKNKFYEGNLSVLRQVQSGSDAHSILEKVAYYLSQERPFLHANVNWSDAQKAMAEHTSYAVRGSCWGKKDSLERLPEYLAVRANEISIKNGIGDSFANWVAAQDSLAQEIAKGHLGNNGFFGKH